MRLIIKPDYDRMSVYAADYVINRINEHNKRSDRPFVLGLPTGSSPIGMYRELVKAVSEGRVSFRNVVTFNMDEYVGLPEEHSESYHLSCTGICLIISTARKRIYTYSTAMPMTS